VHSTRKAPDAIAAPGFGVVPTVALVVVLDGQVFSPTVCLASVNCTVITLGLIQRPVIRAGKSVAFDSPIVHPTLVIVLTRPAINTARRAQRIITTAPGTLSASHRITPKELAS
jgi:hypothetical protein